MAHALIPWCPSWIRYRLQPLNGIHSLVPAGASLCLQCAAGFYSESDGELGGFAKDDLGYLLVSGASSETVLAQTESSGFESKLPKCRIALFVDMKSSAGNPHWCTTSES